MAPSPLCPGWCSLESEALNNGACDLEDVRREACSAAACMALSTLDASYQHVI